MLLHRHRVGDCGDHDKSRDTGATAVSVSNIDRTDEEPSNRKGRQENAYSILDEAFYAFVLVSLPTWPLEIVVPFRWGTRSAAAPEPQAPARNDGEHRLGNKTRFQDRWERKTPM